MKQIISDEDIEKAAFDYGYGVKQNFNYASYNEDDFKAGVSYAESYIKTISVKFAEWVAARYTLSRYKEWCSLGMPTIVSTETLFEEFLNDTNEKG